MSGKCNSYTANFKLQVIALAESASNSMAVRCFSINEKLLRDWRKKQNDLSEISKSKKTACGRPPMFPKLEERLASWVEEPLSQDLIITSTANVLGD